MFHEGIAEEFRDFIFIGKETSGWEVWDVCMVFNVFQSCHVCSVIYG